MTDPRAAPPGGRKLLRAIGFLGLAVLALNSVVGAGIFALPAAIAERAGVLSPYLFLVVGVLVLTIVLTFAELSSYFRDSGGPVLFTTRAFGPLTGFSTGWLLFLSRMTAFAANSTVMALYLGDIFPWFADGVGRALLIVTIAGGLTWANYVGVRGGVRTLGVLTFLKLAPIVLLILLGLTHVTGGTLIPEALPVIDDVGGTTLLLIYAYIGFESTTIVSGEAKNPSRGLPRALVSTVALIGVLYFLIVLVYVAVLPEADGSATLVDVGRALMGPAGAIAITLAAFFSIGGNLASIMLAVPRLTFALGEERLLPKWFSTIHEKYATPANSILFLGVLGTAFAITGTFEQLAVASSLMRLIGYVLCIVALPFVRRQADEETRAQAYRVKGSPVIASIALGLSLWIASQSAAEAWLMTGGLLAGGLVLYWLSRQRRVRQEAE